MNSSYRHANLYGHWRRNKAGVDPQGELQAEAAHGGQTVSIIEYSAEKKARNSYPYKIVSPPGPSRCCQARMNRIGAVQTDGDHNFYYKRCSRCGFTVREFVSPIDIDRLVSAGGSDWDHTERWLDRIQRDAEADMAA
ncbi:MAG: hypothetical protein C3F12_14295 [Candidatus Methylomirabilota bacterium]|nr:hypothetical protein [Candidatus Methylomirabilis sp.]NJD69660.1 hypothetical protein [candidate division NC10 bacterium]PWB42374.1 MAG: hypothetical protein C3F12_14295 [candidate division NC10 bacterium]